MKISLNEIITCSTFNLSSIKYFDVFTFCFMCTFYNICPVYFYNSYIELEFTCGITHPFEMISSDLTGVAQLVGHHPAKRMVAGLIAGQGMASVTGLVPHWGV